MALEGLAGGIEVIGFDDGVAVLPVLPKDNYLRTYPLPQLCRGGRLVAGDLIAVSPGSTGEPTFWPRSAADEVAVVAPVRAGVPVRPAEAADARTVRPAAADVRDPRRRDADVLRREHHPAHPLPHRGRGRPARPRRAARVLPAARVRPSGRAGRRRGCRAAAAVLLRVRPLVPHGVLLRRQRVPRERDRRARAAARRRVG